ncbi:hypothetical protein FM076_02075 [Streptomyces albus subsp. chlorinus]|uniref:hypothetical protein n=1 Tax=Streptomyces albus TaxID=1888 RepID=UPI00156E59CC|nr:hypothetical protein [Streptomyces albus]NSC20056.1 hypothetical protein [Streptomyces albus subsp. chlorinus]
MSDEFDLLAARMENRRAAEDAERELAGFDEALARLSLTDAEVPLTREVLGRPQAYPTLAAIAWLVTAATAVFLGLAVEDRLEPSHPSLATAGGASAAMVFAVVLGSGSAWLLTRTRAGGEAARNRLVHVAARTVLACARVHDVHDLARRAGHMRQLDRSYRQLEQAVLRAHRARATMPFSSPRHAVARQHAAWVVGALRQDIYRLDTEPDDAVRKLAAKVVLLGERYAEGRVGALLPEEALEGAEPVSLARRALRESAHMALVLVAAVAGAWAAQVGGQAIDASKGLQAVLLAVGVVLGGTLAGGWQRASRLVELLPGK